MAATRKRVAAALQTGESSLHQQPATKRKRLAAGDHVAEVHTVPFEPADELASAGNLGEHQEVDGSLDQQAEGHSDRQIFLLDIFCGTAGVAAAFKACGGDALGIDHIIDKRRVKGPVSKVDLTQQSGQDTILGWLRDGRVDAVMLAPPCGTASRAREIPIPHGKGLKRQPMPLRSDKFPMGIPSLKGVARQKVKAANRLYKFARKVIDVCVEKDIPVICENPRRSLMWLTEYFRDLPAQCLFQHIHSCMYGGKRKKRTSFLMNFKASNLLLECDGQHPHLPWGMVQTPGAPSELKFSTSLETEYPSCVNSSQQPSWSNYKREARPFPLHSYRWISHNAWGQVYNHAGYEHQSSWAISNSRLTSPPWKNLSPPSLVRRHNHLSKEFLCIPNLFRLEK